MQRHVARIGHDGFGHLIPVLAAVARQVIPMEIAGVELAFRPGGKVANGLGNGDVRRCAPQTMRGGRKGVICPQILAHPHDEDTAALLGHAIVRSVEHIGLDAVTRLAKNAELVLQQVRKVFAHHARDVFHHKRFGFDQAQCPRELQIQLVDVARRLAHAPLAEALAGVAAHQQLGRRKHINLCHIAQPVVRIRMVGQVNITRIGQLVIGHDHVEPGREHACVRAATP